MSVTLAAPQKTTAGTFQSLPIDRVDESPLNTRRHFDPKSIDELAASIRSHGVLTPILVRPNGKRFEIAAGARRIRAARKAKITEIPAVVQEMDDVRFLEVITIENLQREDVHPLDEALGYKALIERAGYDPQQIADRIGKSLSYVYQRMQLAKLIPPIQKLFQAEKITASHAVLIARLQPADQEKVLKSALFEDRYVERADDDGGFDTDVQITATVSVRALDAWIRQNLMLDLHAAPWKKADATLYPEAGPCTTCPKRAGNQPSLFPDVKKGDTCTDPSCFAVKMARFFKRKREEVAKESPHPVLLLTMDYWTNRKDLVNASDWKKVDGKPCAYATKGIVAEGTHLGQVLTVCADKRCKVHHGAIGRAAQTTAAERAHQQEYERREKIAAAVRLAIGDAIIKRIEGKLSGEPLRLIATALLRDGDLGDEEVDWISRSLGLGVDVDEARADSRLRVRIPKMTDRELYKLLVGCVIAEVVTASWNWLGTSLPKFAAALKINTQSIERAVRKEFTAAAKTERAAKMNGQTSPNGAKARARKVQTSTKPARVGKR